MLCEIQKYKSIIIILIFALESFNNLTLFMINGSRFCGEIFIIWFHFVNENNQIIFSFDLRPQTVVHTITYSSKPLNIVKMVLKYYCWCKVYNCLDFDIICNIVCEIFDVYKILKLKMSGFYWHFCKHWQLQLSITPHWPHVPIE